MPKTLKISSIILFFLGLLPVVSSQAQSTDSLRIVTYYPSPFGTYRELRTKRMAIGDDYIKTGAPPDKYDWQEYATDPMHNIGYDADLVVQGNVGIGTTNPNAKLEVAGSVLLNSSNAADQYVRIMSSGSIAGQGGLRFDQNSNHFFTMWTEGTGSAGRFYTGYDGTVKDTHAKMVLNSDGNVGIGTINPQARLDIVDSAGNGSIRIGGDNNGSTTCSVAKAGTVRYNAGTMQYCDGTTSTWKSIGGGFFPEDVNTTGWGNESGGSVTFPNGLIMKWGAKVIPAHYDNTLVFATPFPHACFQVIVCEGQTGNGYDWNVNVSNITRTSAVINSRTYSSPVRWFAIGR